MAWHLWAIASKGMSPEELDNLIAAIESH